MSTVAIQEPQAKPNQPNCPSNALRFVANALQFAASKDKTEMGTKSRAISLLARTPEPIYHWYWGWCVHNFAGMKHKERIVLDWCHSDSDLIGFAEEFVVDQRGLTLNGRIESVSDDDEAEKLVKRADKGIPFEASIYFNPHLLEFIPEGSKAEINGVELSGPMTVFSEWSLRACSVCPHGYDGGTESKLNAAGESDAVHLSWKENSMSTEKNRDALKAELKLFTDRFGANDGLNYFNAGTSLEEATAAQLTKLTASHAEITTKLAADHEAAVTKLKADHDAIVAKLTKERDEAIAARDESAGKLSAAKVSLGEPTGIETGVGGAAPKKLSFTQAVLQMKSKKAAS